MQSNETETPKFDPLNDLTTKYYRHSLAKDLTLGCFAPCDLSIPSPPISCGFVASLTADACKQFCVTSVVQICSTDSVHSKSANCHISCMCLLKPQSYLQSQPVSWFLHNTNSDKLVRCTKAVGYTGAQIQTFGWAAWLGRFSSSCWRRDSWNNLAAWLGLQLFRTNYSFGSVEKGLFGCFFFTIYVPVVLNTCSLLGSERKSNLKVSTTSAFSWRSKGSWKVAAMKMFAKRE